MRNLIVAITAIALTIAAPVRGQPGASAPQACFVAELGLVVEEAPAYRFHRIVVAGIRKVEPAADASEFNCEPRNLMVTGAMRRAVEQHLDSVVAPRVRTVVEVRHHSIDVVKGEIARFAERARAHAGTFRRVEWLKADLPAADAPAFALPRLSISDADAAACAQDNAKLERATARYRWAC